jgi:hypothetical protein
LKFNIVDEDKQIFVMVVFFVVLLLCFGILLLMAKSCRCCKHLLSLTVGCKWCEQRCSAKARHSSSTTNQSFCRRLGFIGHFSPCGAVGGDFWLFQLQLFLLSWKRVLENTRNIRSVSIYFSLPVVALIVIKLLYGMLSGFSNFDSSGDGQTNTE